MVFCKKSVVFCHKTKVAWNCLKWIDLKSKNFPHRGGGLFCHKDQSCLKLPEMDRSGQKIFPHLGGGGFSATKTKVAWNYLKWINLKSKNFPSSGGGLFCYKNQSCLKLPEMDKSEVKKFSLILGGGLFCHKNQSEVQWCMKYWCLKLRHVPQYKPSISPKGRKEGGAFRPICSLWGFASWIQ